MSDQENLYQKIVDHESHYTTIEEFPRNTKRNRFIESLESIKDYGYYWGPITAETACRLLGNQPNGTFILRDSFNLSYIFAVTFKHADIIHHVHLQQFKGEFSFGLSPEGFSTITDVIEKTVEMSRNGRFMFLTESAQHGLIPLNITNPLSRFQKVQTLKHICRYNVIKYMKTSKSIDHLGDLVPKSILEYLRDKKYFYDAEGYGMDF